jgi:hypothetical protein
MDSIDQENCVARFSKEMRRGREGESGELERSNGYLVMIKHLSVQTVASIGQSLYFPSVKETWRGSSFDINNIS